MYVHICMCMPIGLYVYVNMYGHVFKCLHICMSVCLICCIYKIKFQLFQYAKAVTPTSACTSVHTYLQIVMCVRMKVCTTVCMPEGL